ncbi:androgen-dependent TFPI-regulating protein-like [Coccinella septempunctata]|uniref:androgen-dependent TFPI-regulating protein-like n=1 Tax=Coccinella septempunctata TaxID=41139 RepID=UPI001D081743|nr:androgen-dependent TFPI-regulating protein-like [Coccinella septempunctata]XP_044746077.1 androgen-dependent TFPI-regulating protein-like [Coccinella septempunctata]
MVENLKIYFHSFVLLTFISGLVWQLINMKDEIPEDRYVADVFEYKERYFTMWNMVLQFIYFSMALSEDVLDTKTCKVELPFSRPTLIRLKAFIFSALAVPGAAFVCVVFWGYYFYDRDLVFPKYAEYFCMLYSNHVAHTSVGVFVLLEFLFIRHHPVISFTSCFLAMTAVHLSYYVVFFYHRFSLGRFLYPVFYNLTWFQVGQVLTMGYVWTLLAAKIGIEVQKYMKVEQIEEKASDVEVKS